MKLNIKLLGLMTLFAALSCALGAKAENKLSVEPFVMSSYDVMQVPVILENTDQIGAFQFDLALPEDLVLAGELTPNPARLNSGKQIIYNEKNGRVMVVARDRKPILGNEGPVIYLPVRVKYSHLANLSESLKFSNINFTTVNASQSFTQPDFETTVTIQAGTSTLYTEQTTVYATPGKTFDLSVGVKNTSDIMGMQVDIKLPAGFSLSEDIEKGDRLTSGANVQYYPTSGRIIVSDWSGADAINGEDGILFTLKITAPETFAAETEIVFDGLEVSNQAGTAYVGTGCSVKVVNGGNALAAANAKIAELKKALDDALSTIASECPAVKDQFTGSEISSQISTLEQAVKDAYDNGTLTPNYDEVMKPAADITTATEKLVADAKAAQAAHNDNETAKVNADKAVADLEKALTDALSTIATDCPAVKDQFTGSEVTAQIEALKNAVAEAYTSGTLAAKYDEVMSPVSAITSATEKLVADAKAAQAAHDGEETAKVNADKAVADLEKALTDALSTIANECPAVKDQFTGSEITAQIEALKNAVADAYTAGTLAANYNEVMAPAAAITAATEKLVADAKAAQLAYEGEQAAKANADSRVADLEKQLADALTTIANECPDVKDNFNGADVTAKIEAIKTAVAEQYAAGTLAANYDKTVTAPAEAVANAIVKLVSDAKAAQAPITANKEAFAKANAEISRLESELATAVATIANECPAVKDQFTGSNVTAMINALRNEVGNANALGTLGTTYDYIVPQASADITAAINKLVVDAKAAQIAHDGEESAKANADKAVADLEAALKAALETIATECPAVKDQFTGAEITAQIEALKNAVAKAYAAGTLAANYREVMAPAAAITAATEKLVADAKAAQAAIEGEEAALKKAAQEIEALNAELSKALAEIAESCPDVKGDFDGKNVESMIAALDAAAKEAATNGTLAANYDKVMAPAAAVRTAIDKLVADAKAAQAKYEDDARRAANEKAYNEVVEQLDMLQDELDTMLEKVSVEYPGATVASETLAAQRAINDARIAAQKAYNAVADSGEYDYEVDTDAIRKLIDAILDKAIASGIDSITNDEGEVRYFDLQGVEVKNPIPGSIVIKVSADGTRTKVLVK